MFQLPEWNSDSLLTSPSEKFQQIREKNGNLIRPWQYRHHDKADILYEAGKGRSTDGKKVEHAKLIENAANSSNKNLKRIGVRDGIFTRSPR